MPNPWEDPMLAYWGQYRSVCKNKSYIDDKFCEHPDNKFGDCGPAHCPTVKVSHMNEMGLQTPPPPLPTIKPDYWRVQSDLVLQGTLETTTWDECPGSKTVEDLLFELLPSEDEEDVTVKKMVFKAMMRKR